MIPALGSDLRSRASNPVCWLLLAAIVLLGTWLRLLPVLSVPESDYLGDAEFNYRMTREVVQSGRLPEVDRLSTHPVGKHVSRELPVFHYHLQAAFHHAAALAGRDDLKQNTFLYNALLGALIAIPVYILTLALVGSRQAALIAALIAVILPMGMIRSFSVYNRQEVTGVTAGLLALALWIRACCEPGDRRSLAFSAAAGAAFIAAFASWRMNLLLFHVISVIFLLMATGNFAHKRQIARGMTILCAAYLLSCIGLEYLRHYRVILSAESALTFVTLVASAFVWKNSKLTMTSAQKWIYRAAVVLVLASLTWLFMRFGMQTPGSGVASLLAIALRQMGYPVSLTDEQNLYFTSVELAPMPLDSLFGPMRLGWMSLWPLVFWVRPFRIQSERPQSGYAWAVSGLVTVVALAGTLLVASRNQVFFSPMFAVWAGIGGWQTAQELRRQISGKWLTAAAVAVMTVFIGVAGYHAYDIMKNLNPNQLKRDDSFNDILKWIRSETEPNAVIWAHWAHGYPIQTRSERATILDGLFEVPEMRRRVLEEKSVVRSGDPQKIFDFCKKYGVSYVLVSMNHLPSYRDRRMDRDDVLDRIVLQHPEKLPFFETLFRNERFVFYKFNPIREAERAQSQGGRTRRSTFEYLQTAGPQ